MVAIKGEPKTAKEKKEELVKRIRDATANDTAAKKMRVQARVINDYIKGKQWQEYNEVTGVAGNIPVPENPKDRIDRQTDNIIFPMWRTYKSMLLRSMPVITAKPQNTEDVHDTLAVEMAETLVEYNHRVLIKSGTTPSDLANIMLSYGSVFLHPYWDSGRKVVDRKFMPPSQIFVWPPEANTWDNVLGVTWQRAVPLEVAKLMYPGKDFKEDEIPEHLWVVNTDVKATDLKNHVLMNTYYQRPFGKDPGCYISTGNNIVLEEEYIDHFPYKHGRIPYIKMDDIDMGDSLFGIPCFKLILGKQLSHNKIESLIMEMAKILPQLLIPDECKVDPNQVISTMTRVFEYYSQYGSPGYSQPPPPNLMLMKKSAEDPQQAEHTLGLHGVTLRAETIGSLQSGYALERLQETDMGRMLPTNLNQKAAYEEFHTQVYEIQRTKAEKKDIIALLGDKAELYYDAYKRTKLKPMNFTIEANSLFPESEAIKKENMSRALQYGAINTADPRERRVALQVLVPKLAKKIDPDIREEERQRAENILILKGEKIDVKRWDKDEVHIPVLNEIIHDMNFEKLDDNIKAAALAHLDQHEKRQQDRNAKMMALIAAQKNAQLGITEQKPGKITKPEQVEIPGGQGEVQE